MNLGLDRTRYETHTFGDLIQNVTDRVDDPRSAGVERYVGLEHLDGGELAINRWGSPDDVEAQKLRFQSGDIVFGRRRAYQKKVAYADFEGICSAHALVLRAIPGKIVPEFLPHFIASDYFLNRAIDISVGSLSPTVNWRDLKVQEFDLPPLDEQHRIADLLWAIEDAYRCAALQVEKMGAALAIHADEMIWRHTGRTPLGDLLESCDYGSSARASADFDETSTPILRIPNVVGGAVDLSDLKYVDDSVLGRGNLVRAGDLLIVRTNGNPSYVSRGALVPELDRDFAYASYLIRLRADAGQLNPEFLFELWETPTMKRQLSPSIRSSAGNFNLSAASIKAQRVPIPELHLQRGIALYLAAIRADVDQAADEVRSLANVRRSANREVFA